MNKEMLINTLKKTNTYNWCLYFFRIDRRNNNPYSVYKIRFKNNQYIRNYAETLVDMVIEYQLQKIAEISDYTGENTKVSCDRIKTSDDLLCEQWNYFVNDIANATDEKIEGKYHGYVLEGVPTNNDGHSIAFLKMANPIINLKNKRNAVFSFDPSNELCEMSDEMCKLYMNVDCIVTDEVIYSFNYKFEDVNGKYFPANFGS